MRVLIPGGTGLIGKALASSLLADGHEVVILTRNPEKAKNLPSGVTLAKWDGKRAQGWQEWAEGAGAIINLAGEGVADKPWSNDRKRAIRDSRTHAGAAVVEAVEQCKTKPGVVIQASAVGYYGVHADEPITEQSPPGNDFLAKVCFDWESSTAPLKQMGIRRPILRTGVVLSNEGGAFPKQALPYKLFVGGHLGSGSQWYPWIHIQDEVDAIKFLMNKEDADGAYNLSAPNPVTNKEFSETIGKVMGRPSLFPVPAFALRTLFGEMSTVLLDGQRAIPQRLQDAGFTFQYATAEAALTQLLK